MKLPKDELVKEIKQHRDEMAELRWIMLNMLWHSMPYQTSNEWVKKQLIKAGATQAECEKLDS